MKCPRCLNVDKKYFFKGSKGLYCRKCISYKRMLIEEEIEEVKLDEISDNAMEYILKYPLTQNQKIISKQCLKNINTSDVLINAVCGAGKTEIIIETIAYFLMQNKKVCIAIPRRQVVLELKKRLEGIFTNASVIAICQGSTSILDGDLIICTTHQCYRFYKAFDLLILDEPDAFPYKGNEVLKNIVRTSCKGNIIYLTATLDEYLKKRILDNSIVCLKLNKRFHGEKLVRPKIEIGFTIYLFLRLIKWVNDLKFKRKIIFVPTIVVGEILYKVLKLFYNCKFCCSKTINKDILIKDFVDFKYDLLIATTILERGITIENVNVCVLFAEHVIFDESSLIQISGRVGRSIAAPSGDCLFLLKNKSKEVNNCLKIIDEANDW